MTGRARGEATQTQRACDPAPDWSETTLVYVLVADYIWLYKAINVLGSAYHNPRVGGSSPSSGITKCLEHAGLPHTRVFGGGWTRSPIQNDTHT
jgi:hypothetical protein